MYVGEYTVRWNPTLTIPGSVRWNSSTARDVSIIGPGRRGSQGHSHHRRTSTAGFRCFALTNSTEYSVFRISPFFWGGNQVTRSCDYFQYLIGSMVYLPIIWLSLMVNVGKYTVRPMDPMDRCIFRVLGMNFHRATRILDGNSRGEAAKL